MLHFTREPLHAFTYGLENKPIAAIINIHNALAHLGTDFFLPAAKKMTISENDGKQHVLLITEGCFSISHGTSDLYMATVFAPTTIGIVDSCNGNRNVKNTPRHYIRAETHCHGWSIPLELFTQKCNEQNLWHDIAIILAHRVMIMSARETELVGNSAYSKIRSLLLELWEYPEKIREQIKTPAFIQRRSGISRSRVMDVLSELKKGGYIQINSGTLVSLNKLPVDF